MPEGDTIFRAAATLNRALAGGTVVRFESVFPGLTRVDEQTPLAGRTIDAVRARGKHLLMVFSGDLVLHTHLRMNGSWHLYRPGESWHRTRRDMRIVLATDTFEAVGFNLTVAEFLTGRDIVRHPQLRALGPDLAAGPVDRDDVRRRLDAHAPRTIADALLDQRVMSGIGNVLKSEILFVSGVNPFTPAAQLPPAVIDRILDASERLMALNTSSTPGQWPGRGRRTTGSLDPRARLWVYGRAGRPCRKCGGAIQFRKEGADARVTYWCPRCQA